MALKKDLALLIKPYYLVNLILSLSYVVAKKTPHLCEFLFPRSLPLCELDGVSFLFYQSDVVIFEFFLLFSYLVDLFSYSIIIYDSFIAERN